MYAVISSGGKQYRVKEGDTLKLESISSDVGSTIQFDKVLAIGAADSIKLGQPYITGCNVSATILTHGRHKKIHIIKFRRRKHHEKWQGHRQNFTEVKITRVEA